MRRYTVRNKDGSVSIPEADLQEGIRRFAAFEDAYFELTASQSAIPAELERLKTEGKEKTVRYKELLGQKLINNQVIMLFERYGIKME